MPVRPCLFLACVLLSSFVLAAEFEHGDAIVLSSEEIDARTTAGSPLVGTASSTYTNGQVSGFSVDTTDRTEVLSFYHCIYSASEGFENRMNWAGNIPGCSEGSVSSAFHDDTLRRINYYRAMAGLNTDIYFDAAKNAKCQEAALIMARNNGLSHDPIGEHPVWSCLTVDGDEAAGKSNLSRGTFQDYTGPRAVDGQIRDDGANNVLVGHRRWLLYPRAREMGNGGIPWVSGYSAAASVWVIGNWGSRPPSPPWIGWPNPGYIPYDLVPARWSLSMEGADFDNATVTMTQNGNPISLTKIHPTPSSPAVGAGDPSIVWEPAGIPSFAPLTDDTYTVTVFGIVDGVSDEVSYTVTLIDPYTLGQDMVISGPEHPQAFTDNTCTFPTFDAADAYHLRIRKIANTTWLEGAENAPAPRIIDSTDPVYSLRQGTVVRTGSRAFHVAFPNWYDQVFEIDRIIVPSAGSELEFAYLRRFSSVANEFVVQVSTNDGAGWMSLWSVNGICGSGCNSGEWDANFIPVSYPLGTYAGQPIRIRFLFAHNYDAYLGSSTDHGFFIDDITVTDGGEEVGITETDIPGTASSFALHPDGVHTYIMDMFVELGCHTFDYGPQTTASSVPGLWISRIEESAGQVTVGFDVTGGTYAAHSLYRMDNPVGAWTQDAGAAYHPAQREFTTPASAATLYRVTGDM